MKNRKKENGKQTYDWVDVLVDGFELIVYLVRLVIRTITH